MLKNIILAVAMGVAFLPALGSAPDEQIKAIVIRSGQVIDNSRRSSRMFNHAKGLCEDDTNRFARILCELAQTNDVRIADRMVDCLGWHGTTAQLPFLYSMATNEQHGAAAVKSILRLEGVTSNAVSIAESYLFSTNCRNRVRYEICDCLISQFAKSPACRSLAEGVAIRFMADYNIYHDWLDVAMKRADPTYSQSKRRLSVLRAISRRVTDANDLAYVTNAINELVAYPEADLPE